MEEGQSENTCDLCKISYASESELTDHIWSLMHHIKIEQRKKGCSHTCSLCLANCENIIEYGKHLNDDRHKHALSRRNKDPSISDVLDSFGQSETGQLEREPEFREPEPVTDRKRWMRTGRQTRSGGHSRSYSEPDIDLDFQQEYDKAGNRQFNGKPKQWKKKKQNKDYGPHDWQDFEYDDWGSYNSWRPYDNKDGPEYWNGSQRTGFWDWGGPAYEQFAPHNLYTAFDDNSESDWRQTNNRPFRPGKRALLPTPSNRRGSFDSSSKGHSQIFSEQERRGRGLTRGPRGKGITSNDKSSPDSNSSNESVGLKRRCNDDLEMSNGKLRKGNSNKRIMELPRPLTPGSDYTADSLDDLMEDRSNKIHSRLVDRISSPSRKAKSLPVRMDISPSKRSVTPSPPRSSDRKSKQVTWASDMVSSTTDIDSDQQVAKTKRCSSLTTKRSSSLDSALRRNKMPDSTSERKVGKKSSTCNTKEVGKAKMKGKNKLTGSSPSGKKSSRSKDEGESVLEKAEKLCKKLREEREKGKKEKEVKEKQKKLEKHKELNSQIKLLTEKNKANIKGCLEEAESMINKNLNNSGTISEIKNSGSLTASKNIGILEKAAVSLGISMPDVSGTKQSSFGSDTKAADKKKNTKAKPDIERIRETIESSVRTELNENAGKTVLDFLKSTDQSVSKSESNLSPPAFPSPLAKHMLAKQKSDSGSSYDKGQLVKMVNSPRTTKERLQIAEMLRTYAKSQTKLSLPRFDLKVSDLCSGSGDRHDEIAELNLENMSPDLQLEIANLIEADVKPDITELEKLLDFQSAANEMLDMEILDNLGFLSPSKQGMSSGRSASPAIRSVTPIVSSPTFHKQFSSSESAVSKFQNASVPIKQEFDSAELEIRTKRDSKYSGLAMNLRSPSPVRKEIQTKETYDGRPSLSIEDLEVSATDKSRSESPLMALGFASRNVSVKPPVQGQNKELNSESSKVLSSRFSQSPAASVGLSDPQPTIIKEEKIVPGYEKAEEMSSRPILTGPYDKNVRQQAKDNKFSSSNIEIRSNLKDTPGRASSPVRQSLFHSTNLSRQPVEEIPVKDSALKVNDSLNSQQENDKLTALEKVKSILDEAPNMERVLGYQQSNIAVVQGAPTVGDGLAVRDKSLDVSQGSQPSSILDQVYSISLQEENVRQELSTVNQKIAQLQKLLDEATQQMNKFTERKEQLLKEEDEMRSTRMRLLQDSRSQSSAGSQPEAQYQAVLPHLTDAQLHNLSNPVFMKFLMSQRNQSDLSSVGGFSNVESGSQIDPEHGGSLGGSRRGSFTSNITEPVSITADRPLTPRKENNSREEEDDILLSQSVDILSGSAPSLSTLKSNQTGNITGPVREQSTRDSVLDRKVKDGALAGSSGKNRTAAQSDSQKSFSFINSPLEKSGFVTLDELMNENSDMSKLLQRSLESADQNILSGFEREKGAGSDVLKDKSQLESRTDVSRPLPERERKDSIRSAGSDDIVVSGSDIDKRSGKVSMKFMGTIPDGVNYTDFMKQIAHDSKSKSVMYTVVTSPEAVSQLQKISDSGLGTGSLSSLGLPKTNIGDNGLTSEVKDAGYRSEGSMKSTTTGTLTINDVDFESQSVKSTYSLGEQIKRFCERQNSESDQLNLKTPKSVPEGDKLSEDKAKESVNMSDTGKTITPSQSPSRKMLQSEFSRHENLKGSKMETSGVSQDALHESSPTRKKLKTKKERDRKSRRKQKEEFILESSSDTNSVEEEPLSSLKMNMGLRQPSLPEEDLLATGSEDQKNKTGNQCELTVKRSLLDEVQLETETPSDSCDDRNKGQAQEDPQRLKVKPEVLESFRSAVKTKLQGGKTISQSTPVIQYKGPSLSVATIQVFKGDVYVCYNGSELRRFNLKTGEILKELDCSPYLVQCLHVSSVDEREDILYTGGACKKLMLFKPQKFNLIETYDYDERITCLHENWGRLFVGLSDGVVSVRSTKTDKELNTFQTTNKSVQCLASTSAGMTKMLCCGCSDKIIYVLDAISGLLLTMLQGHMLTPLCMEIFDDLVVSGAADKNVLVHNVRSGCLEASIKDHKAMVSQITSNKDALYTACYDKLVRCYSKKDFKIEKVYYGAGKGMLTSILYHDDKLLTGNREGLVESVPIGSSSSWTCQCDNCKLDFPIREHLLHHVLTDHLLPNSRMIQCPWTGCSQWLSTVDSSQKAEEHIITEHFK